MEKIQDSENEKQKAKAVGHIPSGLFIICSLNEDGIKDGFLGSWVQQVSFRPLLVGFAIKPDRPGHKHIISGKTFTINIVGDHDAQILKHFWSGYAPGKGPFQQIPHKISPEGGILLDSAKSILVCKMVQKIIPGDHEWIIAEIINSLTNNEESSPKVHIRKSGLEY